MKAGNSCCGARCKHQTGVACARSIHGPCEKNADNPIFRYATTPSTEAAAPHAGTMQQAILDFSNKFETNSLGIEWITIHYRLQWKKAHQLLEYLFYEY